MANCTRAPGRTDRLMAPCRKVLAPPGQGIPGLSLGSVGSSKNSGIGVPLRAVIRLTSRIPSPGGAGLGVGVVPGLGVGVGVGVGVSVGVGVGVGVGVEVTVIVMVASLEINPFVSFTVYLIEVVVPVKPGSGIKVTFPVDVSTVYVPCPATVRVVCCPGVSGSRSIVVGSKLKT